MPDLTDDDETELGPKGNPTNFIKAWMTEIKDALKREKKYRERGAKVVKLYEAREPENTPFAILYSNTETLVPAIYSALPIPMVQRKFKDPDPVGKAVSEVCTRVAKFLLDNDDEDFDCFDDLTQQAVLDAVLVNRGLSRFRYFAHENGYGEECVYGEAVRWDKFIHGYARTWKKVPWIGFEWDMSSDELKKNFKKAKFTDLRKTGGSTDDGDNAVEGQDREELTGVRTYKVYEIWDKRTKKVFFISPLAPDTILKYSDDPLKLTGFFPVPKPMNFMRKVTTLVPTPLYEQYKQQASELNELTRRLKAIVKAIKFRGAYNSAVEGIEKMLQADDNEMVPVENCQSMPDGSGMDKLLWTVPVQELAVTAQSLYQQREQVKQVIYEITGISDILRGSTVASETATAQTIKQQWGTLRLRRMQREVQRYCRDAVSIIIEIAATNFDLKTIQQMTGLPYMTEEQKAQVQQQLQMQQMQAAQQAQQAAAAQPPQLPGQPPAQPPQPPAPPQLPPQIALAMQAPSWDQIMQVLQNRLIFNYKIDIETDSTIDAEASQDKQDISDLLNALSQFLNGIAPLVQEQVMPMEVAKQMLLTISRRYNFGSQLEDAINMMQPPPPKGPDPADQAKAMAESAKAQTEQMRAQNDQVKMSMEQQLEQQKFEHTQAEAVLEHNLKMQEMQAKVAGTQNQMTQLAQKAEFSALQHEQRMAMMRQEVQSVDDSESD
jgi:hypothetical protein